MNVHTSLTCRVDPIPSELVGESYTAMDSITALKPDVADAGPPAELPHSEANVEPLSVTNELDEPNARTKGRIYAILAALYVSQTLAASSSTSLLNIISFPACPLRSSTRSNYCRNIHPHNLRRSTLGYRLHLDRRRLLTRQRSSRTYLDQMQRHLGS